MGKRPFLWMFAGFVLVIFVAWGVGFSLSSREAAPTRPVNQASANEYRGWAVDPVVDAPDFTLTDQHGNSFSMSDQAGKAVVLFFGYTTCPDVCPTTLAQFKAVKAELGEAAEDVEFVFVSVDPERDTQERMARYVSLFDESFIGLTGDRESLEKVWEAYGIMVERAENPDNPESYWVNHTSLSYVVDPEGQMQLVHPFGLPEEDVVYDLRKILGERA